MVRASLSNTVVCGLSVSTICLRFYELGWSESVMCLRYFILSMFVSALENIDAFKVFKCNQTEFCAQSIEYTILR